MSKKFRFTKPCKLIACISKIELQMHQCRFASYPSFNTDEMVNAKDAFTDQ